MLNFVLGFEIDGISHIQHQVGGSADPVAATGHVLEDWKTPTRGIPWRVSVTQCSAGFMDLGWEETNGRLPAYNLRISEF